MDLDNDVPSKTFEVRNLANEDGFVYLGKRSLVNNLVGNTVLTNGNNCLATFLIGSVKPGKNIRIDLPTETDPNTFIDAKYFDLQPYSLALSASNLLSSISSSSGDMSYFFKTLINDGSASGVAWTTIEADDESFYIGYNGVAYYKQNNGTYSTIPTITNPNSLVLKENLFSLANTEKFLPSLYTHKTVDDYGNTSFHLNKLIAGKGIKIEDDGESLKVLFDIAYTRPIPCCYDPYYSGGDIIDPVSNSSSDSSQDLCSNIADTYLLGFDYKQHIKIANVDCEEGFCLWSQDTYTFTVTSGNFDPEDFSSPIVPYFIRSGRYYRIKAEKTDSNYYIWNFRIMDYKTTYRDCSDDESSDFYHYFDHDYDQQERKVIRQDVKVLVLTHSTSGFFDMFTRDFVIQPNGTYLYNQELTEEWIAETQSPIYEESNSSIQTHFNINVSELFLDGPHYTENTNTKAEVSAWTNCGPYIETSTSSLSDSDSMGPLVSSSSSSSKSNSSNSTNSSNSSSSSSLSSNSSSSNSSLSSESWSSVSVSQSSQSS